MKISETKTNLTNKYSYDKIIVSICGGYIMNNKIFIYRNLMTKK